MSMSYSVNCPNCGTEVYTGYGLPDLIVGPCDKCSTEHAAISGCPSELQLLIIDLGDSCVVKVEKGDGEFWLRMGGETNDAHSFQFKGVGNDHLCNYPFAIVRAAIDEIEKPVPRIEATPGHGIYSYMLCTSSRQEVALLHGDYEALSKLAGAPLPVYEGKKGEWNKLLTDQAGYDFRFEAWRYTR